MNVVFISMSTTSFVKVVQTQEHVVACCWLLSLYSYRGVICEIAMQYDVFINFGVIRTRMYNIAL